jgi:FSR family fosmidomycin resistance protein-like MFS transporter
LYGTPLLALPAVAMAVVLAIRRPWLAPEVGAREEGRKRAAAGQPDDWRGFRRLTAVVVLRSVAYFGVASLVALFAIRHFHEPTAVGSATLAARSSPAAFGLKRPRRISGPLGGLPAHLVKIGARPEKDLSRHPRP